MDNSGSIEEDEFTLMKNFVSALVGVMDVDSGDTRVGAVVYGNIVHETFHLNDYTTTADVQAAIQAFPHRTGSTNTGGALQYAREVSLIAANGGRSTAPDVVVVLTDGNSNTGPDLAVSREHGMI